MDFIVRYELDFRICIYIGTVLIFATLEVLHPRRKLEYSKSTRWLNNFALTFLNTALLRLFMPLLAVEIAVIRLNGQKGLMWSLMTPYWLNILLSLLILDFLIYWQHRFFHKIPFFWNFHKVHHTDLDLDISSSSRFHTFEILLSMAIKILIVSSLGMHPAGVIVFEILLSSCSNFNHSNILLPKTFNKALERLLVTPDMHRIHHSVKIFQTNSNYGFCLSIWDRLFKSYCHIPFQDQEKIVIGLQEYRNKRVLKLIHMIKIPFTRTKI